MKFILKPNNRDATDEDLLDDLRKASSKLIKQSFSQNEYNTIGRYSSATIKKRFGWNNALVLAGLIPTKQSNVNDEELIVDLKNVAKEITPLKVTKESYNKYGKYSAGTINKRFGWNKALTKAGIKISNNYNVSTEELFENLKEVWIKLGKQPSKEDMRKPVSKYSDTPYKTKFSGWRKALEAFVEFANSEENNQEKQDKTVLQDVTEIKLPNEPYIHKTSRNINLRMRFLVMRRDNFKCAICGRSPATNPKIILHVDHIVPWDKNGETILQNLQTLCSDDNLGKSNLEMHNNETDAS